MKLWHHLNQYISIYLHRAECRKTSFIHCFIKLTGSFFIFLFIVTGREIIFICSSGVNIDQKYPISLKITI